jgi:hypothetical protein
MAENKNIHANMTKQLIRSISYRLLLHRNNMIVIKKQYMFLGHMCVRN